MTLRKEVLQHLGIEPGGKIEVDLLPGGLVSLKAARPAGTIDGFIGLLAGKTSKVATLEEIEEASVQGWAECARACWGNQRSGSRRMGEDTLI